jgi:hypothetical protein
MEFHKQLLQLISKNSKIDDYEGNTKEIKGENEPKSDRTKRHRRIYRDVRLNNK